MSNLTTILAGWGISDLHTPNATLVTITPEVAQCFLDSQKANRNRNLDRVNRYQRDMETPGSWEVTGESIIIATSDTESPSMIDGQHRCAACVAAGVPFKTFVVTGVGKKAQIIVDQGASRTKTSQLQILGHARPGPLAATATALWKLNYNRNGIGRRPQTPSIPEILRLLKSEPDIRECLEKIYAIPANAPRVLRDGPPLPASADRLRNQREV